MNYRQPLLYFPQKMASRAMLTYFAALAIVSVMFSSQVLPFGLFLFGVVSILLFFVAVPSISMRWATLTPQKYIQHLLLLAIIIRAIYIIFIYNFNLIQYTTYYESNAGDIPWYEEEAKNTFDAWSHGQMYISHLLQYNVDIGDVGYIVYWAFILLLTGGVDMVIPVLALKAIWGGLTCVFMFRLARNHFGEHVGRMTGLFCALQASMIWWCGSMMKETEMIFLMAWFLCRADEWLTSGRPAPIKIIETIVACGLLFTFRSALGVVSVLAIMATILLNNQKTVSWAKKIGVVAILGIVILGFAGRSAIQSLTRDLNLEQTKKNKEAMMEWRAKRSENGNTFAKYATTAVFAPLIFTIPFPTMVYTTQEQEMQTMVNGGNFEKNLFSYFVILSMFVLLFSGDWRQHVFPIAVLCGYLVALVISDFAQSGRFHMPAIPLEMMFAAYGISLCGVKPKFKRWYTYALVACFVACVAWNYFKLAGKGLA